MAFALHLHGTAMGCHGMTWDAMELRLHSIELTIMGLYQGAWDCLGFMDLPCVAAMYCHGRLVGLP